MDTSNKARRDRNILSVLYFPVVNSWYPPLCENAISLKTTSALSSFSGSLFYGKSSRQHEVDCTAVGGLSLPARSILFQHGEEGTTSSTPGV